MKSICRILTPDQIHDLLELSASDGFPYKMTEESASQYCKGKAPAAEGVQTYSVFVEAKLVSVMTATFCMVFPCKDSPSGKIVQISGAYTKHEYRHRHYASDLLAMIRRDAIQFGADYLCCDSIADNLYQRNGFKPASEHETRMWQQINSSPEDHI